MEDCLLCKALKDNNISHKGTSVVIVNVNGQLIATIPDHTNRCSENSLKEVIELFNSLIGNGLISEYDEDLGHWGMKFQSTEVKGISTTKD